ncbi:16S rRNA (guanine(966)-N(2))-methyltransferase RsmD [Oceanibacterium hippocampi]|uniref:Ribosomal RNA small subunit methyltransferase D n=1 Tax=Oceanibacterium hippocampi TaxID=745714 RepID=A0A1Y5S6B6_9PROT|nr:16S rRNA (guanine(966)-N(2))-methyltransferase RsmD [Oceanibacterium hippocampi]SLN32966.1 Ribosomal RNA small subunit methyltransferase D [Oceanibacterium hippocampi]
MRIVGGRYRGRKLDTPEGLDIRPTGERTREALFNILAHNRALRGPSGPLPADAAVLDVFAGSGALGIEALSRGAASVTFIENDRTALALIRRNLAGLEGCETAILQRDARKPGAASRAHDLVLMDAPYGQGLSSPALAALAAGNWLAAGALAVVETAKDEALDEIADFSPIESRAYGRGRLHLLRYRGAATA